MAALSHFISRLGEKGLPFFKLLKAKECFTWTPKPNQAFPELKVFLTTPPIMMAPQPDETLLVYIAATTHVVSTTTIIEREEAGHAYKIQ
jgi:DNA mismatch repair protein MutH